ncbi:hypothetical protein A3K63_03725 [Candidatus Micrarchaeota archaeon RBG_16_49_10]|nr:MAG: hypothetical protein A3K63_03725 [Candidatus Micrarchaeota archaeon RBG_16_49_10]
MRKDTMENIVTIVQCLKQAEEGWLWIREISRRCKLHHKTVSRLIDTQLTMFIEEQKVEPFNIRMFRLKPGTDINGVFRYLSVMKKMDKIF